MVKGDVFLMKPKPQYHLSRWRECVYGAQSRKEKRLFHEIRVYPFEKWTLNKKW